jgi:hypothetical protein
MRKAIIAMGLALSFGGISCDLFKPRTPQAPTQFSSSDIPSTDPEKVLQNIVKAFQEKNAVNYAKSFADSSFSFVPSTNAQNKYGVDWANWNKMEEGKYFEKVISHFTNSQVVLEFASFIPTYNNNISQVETTYHLTLPTDAGIEKKFNGQVQFILERNQYGVWVINKWVDIGTDSTWSDLKAVAYTQWL